MHTMLSKPSITDSEDAYYDDLYEQIQDMRYVMESSVDRYIAAHFSGEMPPQELVRIDAGEGPGEIKIYHEENYGGVQHLLSAALYKEDSS